MIQARIIEFLKYAGLSCVLYVGLNAVLVIGTALTGTDFLIVDPETSTPRIDTQSGTVAVAALFAWIARRFKRQDVAGTRNLSLRGAVCGVLSVVFIVCITSQFLSQISSNAISVIAVRYAIIPAALLGAVAPAIFRKLFRKMR